MDHLIAAISDVRDKLRRGLYANEAEVSSLVVMRLLKELGWAADPEQVRPEFKIGNENRWVDYALLREHFGPAVLVEVKGVGKLTLAGEDQLLNYCFKQGVPLAVLTDGRSWNFYSPAGTGTFERRLFAQIDLIEMDDARCVAMLRRYLLFDAIQSGESRRHVQNDYDRHEQRIVAKEQFRPVLESLIADESALIAVFCDEVEQRCRVRPEKADVTRFLRSRLASTKTTTGPAGPSRPVVTTSQEVSWVLYGERRTFNNNDELIAALFAELANRDSHLLEKLAPRVRKTKAEVLSRRREAFHGKSYERARALPGGWWLNVVGDAKAHDDRIREACEVAGIEYGEQLTVTLRGRRGADKGR